MKKMSRDKKMSWDKIYQSVDIFYVTVIFGYIYYKS